MTRINVVPATELTDKHLLAEYRELPRVFKQAAYAVSYGMRPNDAPNEYRLGKGHVKFFYPRLGFLARRHAELFWEMRYRGFNPQIENPSARWVGVIPDEWWGDYKPTDEALAINRGRIHERLNPRS